MSPELWQLKPYNKKSDVWSLGSDCMHTKLNINFTKSNNNSYNNNKNPNNNN